MSARHTERLRSRSRIGADAARAWVREINLRNPYAKAILMAIANYMNEDGAAWPGLATLSRDTDIGEDTIASRLRWCEDIGVIVQLKTWVDENGRRNHDRRGRPTSSEIRFCFDADIDALEVAADATRGERPLRGAAAKSHAARGMPDGAVEPNGTELSDSDDSQFSTRHGRGLTDEALPPASPRLAPDQPPPGAVRSEESEQEDSPPNPPPGGVEQQDIEGWEDFKRAFEADGEPILRISIALRLFGALKPDERQRVTVAARGLVAYRGKQKRPAPKPSAQTFIREIDAWGSFIPHAPPDPGPAPPPPRFIAADSAEFRARQVLDVLVGDAPRAARSFENGLGWMVAGHDTSPDLLALAAFDPFDTSQWWELDPANDAQRQMIGAWKGRLQRWCGGRALNSKRRTTDEVMFVQRDGTKVMRWRDVHLVPVAWPPRKDGTIPQTNTEGDNADAGRGDA